MSMNMNKNGNYVLKGNTIFVASLFVEAIYSFASLLLPVLLLFFFFQSSFFR